MNYVSTKTIESKTQSGARFVLKRMNERRRTALEELQAAAVAKIQPLMEEFAPLDREYRAAAKASRAVNAEERKSAIANGATEAEALEQWPYGKVEFAAEKFRRWVELRDAIGKIEREEMDPAALRFVVKAIENFQVDGEPVMDAAALVDTDGVPDDFLGEVLLAVKRECGLLPAEAESLSSPSTSAAAVDGENTSGSADPAGTTGTTTAAAAGSSTVPESASVPDTGATP